MLVFMITQVLFYRFIFEVTRTNEQEEISNFNYLFPVILSFLLLIVSLITPVTEQLNVILSKGIYNGGPKLFFFLNYSKISFRLIFSLGYAILEVKRLLRYQKFIRNFSSNEEKGSLRWVSTLILFSILLVLGPLLKIIGSRDEMAYSPIAIFFVMSLLYMHAYICLHVIKRDRFIIDLSNETDMVYTQNFIKRNSHATFHLTNYEKLNSVEIEKETDFTISEICTEFQPVSVGLSNKTGEEEMSPYLKKNILNRDSFDAFMKVEKPYLNADLRITDLVDMLHVNRTYISSFINREYGVNFSAFINRYRLLEYNELKENPKYSKISKSEMAEMVGFNSYRSFQRTEKEFSA